MMLVGVAAILGVLKRSWLVLVGVELVNIVLFVAIVAARASPPAAPGLLSRAPTPMALCHNLCARCASLEGMPTTNPSPLAASTAYI